jgi:hypothetical protein
MCSDRLNINGVERLACRHKESIPSRSAEAHIAADLRQFDLPDALSFR